MRGYPSSKNEATDNTELLAGVELPEEEYETPPGLEEDDGDGDGDGDDDDDDDDDGGDGDASWTAACRATSSRSSSTTVASGTSLP